MHLHEQAARFSPPLLGWLFRGSVFAGHTTPRLIDKALESFESWHRQQGIIPPSTQGFGSCLELGSLVKVIDHLTRIFSVKQLNERLIGTERRHPYVVQGQQLKYSNTTYVATRKLVFLSVARCPLLRDLLAMHTLLYKCQSLNLDAICRTKCSQPIPEPRPDR